MGEKGLNKLVTMVAINTMALFISFLFIFCHVTGLRFLALGLELP